MHSVQKVVHEFMSILLLIASAMKISLVQVWLKLLENDTRKIPIQLVNKLSWGVRVGKGELPPSRELALRLLGHLIGNHVAVKLINFWRNYIFTIICAHWSAIKS